MLTANIQFLKYFHCHKIALGIDKVLVELVHDTTSAAERFTPARPTDIFCLAACIY